MKANKDSSMAIDGSSQAPCPVRRKYLSGVPQESVVGQVLFDIFINSLEGEINLHFGLHFGKLWITLNWVKLQTLKRKGLGYSTT